MQSEYAREFPVFKPDKKLKWFPYIEDRTLKVDVPPLEAAFIDLFSQRRNFYFWFLGVLDIADRSTFLSYLGSQRPHGGGWARWSKCVSQCVADMSRSRYSHRGSRVYLQFVGKGRFGRFWCTRARLIEIRYVIFCPFALDHALKVLPATSMDNPHYWMYNSNKRNRCAYTGRYYSVVFLSLLSSNTNLNIFYLVYWKDDIGPLPLDRIQTMLKFAPVYDHTVEQLGAFMEAARREGLVVRDGIRKLNKWIQLYFFK